ncbi:MAG: hypothetical protein ABII23_00990 [bacterium]
MKKTIIGACVIILCSPAAWGRSIKLHGFLEADASMRFEEDSTRKDQYNFLEQRLQLKSAYYPNTALLADWNSEIKVKGDVWIDEYAGGDVDAELRELHLFFSPVPWADIKCGRQIFTWGTGDYLFINDLFPKDYISFFIGREDEYLKKPSEGIKCSIYHAVINTDIVYIPFFEPNTMPKGEKLSFYDSFVMSISGQESVQRVVEPNQNIKTTEAAARMYRTLGRYEAAGYFF